MQGKNLDRLGPHYDGAHLVYLLECRRQRGTGASRGGLVGNAARTPPRDLLYEPPCLRSAQQLGGRGTPLLPAPPQPVGQAPFGSSARRCIRFRCLPGRRRQLAEPGQQDVQVAYRSQHARDRTQAVAQFAGGRVTVGRCHQECETGAADRDPGIMDILGMPVAHDTVDATRQPQTLQPDRLAQHRRQRIAAPHHQAARCGQPRRQAADQRQTAGERIPAGIRPAAS